MTFACEQACAGDVGTAVTKLHFERFRARRPGKQLMSQTNAEYGCPRLIHGCFDMFHSGFHHGWITRTVGDEQAVVVLASELRKVVVPRYLQYFDSSADETSELVVFKPYVNSDYAYGAAGRVLKSCGRVGRVELRLLDRHCIGVKQDSWGAA